MKMKTNKKGLTLIEGSVVIGMYLTIILAGVETGKKYTEAAAKWGIVIDDHTDDEARAGGLLIHQQLDDDECNALLRAGEDPEEVQRRMDEKYFYVSAPAREARALAMMDHNK